VDLLSQVTSKNRISHLSLGCGQVKQPSRMTVIDATLIAKPFRYGRTLEIDEKRDELKQNVDKRGVHPRLVGFLANSDPAARKYASWTAKTCAETGIDFELREVSRTELEDRVLEANDDENVHGILIYYPCFTPSMDVYLSNCVSPSKDVEGLCHLFRFNMYHNIRFLESPKSKDSPNHEDKRKCILPCTPLAIIKILEYLQVYNSILQYGNRLHGKVVCVVNRSEVVGRPLAAMLANDGATVYSVDVTGILLYHRGEGLKLNRYTVSLISTLTHLS
jgi:methylenetetrahydrofolate dehydrogenase (NAD+)